MFTWIHEINGAKLAKKMLEVSSSQGLDKQISQLIMTTSKNCLKNLGLNLCSHITVIHLNMLGAFMEDWIGRNVYRSLVVTHERHRCIAREPQIKKKTLESY